MRTVIVGALLIALVGGGTLYYLKYAGTDAPANFKTVPVKRGDLAVTIGATGTVEPEEVVDVGSQVTGPILKLGVDPRGDSDPMYNGKPIDYTTPVDRGTVLAQIDPAVYQANYDQAQATLTRAQADLGQLIAKRDQAEAEWKRAQVLHDLKMPALSATDARRGIGSGEPLKAISDSDYDLTKSNYDVAKANVDVGQSTIVQAQAALDLAKTNLSYTTIKSPVKGTIVDRRVNIGQTVVANLSAASLFLIAEDLRRMQVWASVNEADIGRIKAGMPVEFTVAALPEEKFQGKVYQIRLNAASTQNVVNYTVVISFDNTDMKVLPYLTADPIKFIVDKRSDVLLVPNAALTFQPRPEDIAPTAHEESNSSTPTTTATSKETTSKDTESKATTSKDAATTPSTADTASAPSATKTDDALTADSKAEPSVDKPAMNGDPAKVAAEADKGESGKSDAKLSRRTKDKENHGTVWVKEDDMLRPISVQIGATDGTRTEISGADISDGMEVVVGQVREDHAASTDTKNPFAPQFFRGGRGGGGGGQGGGRGGRGG